MVETVSNNEIVPISYFCTKYRVNCRLQRQMGLDNGAIHQISYQEFEVAKRRALDISNLNLDGPTLCCSASNYSVHRGQKRDLNEFQQLESSQQNQEATPLLTSDQGTISFSLIHSDDTSQATNSSNWLVRSHLYLESDSAAEQDCNEGLTLLSSELS